MYYYGYKADNNTPCRKRAIGWEKLTETAFLDRENMTVYVLLTENGLCFPVKRFYCDPDEMSNAEILESLSKYSSLDANLVIAQLNRKMSLGKYLKQPEALTYIELCPSTQEEIKRYLEWQHVRVEEEMAEEARQEAERRKKEEEEERARKEREMEAVREKVLHGGTLEKEEFTYLFAIAAEVDYKIPLRTKGWLIKEGEERRIDICKDGRVIVYFRGKTKAKMPPSVCEGIVKEYRRVRA